MVRPGCRIERDAHRVERAGTDVAVDDADAAHRKAPEPGTRPRGLAAVRRHFASRRGSAQTIGHGLRTGRLRPCSGYAVRPRGQRRAYTPIEPQCHDAATPTFVINLRLADLHIRDRGEAPRRPPPKKPRVTLG